MISYYIEYFLRAMRDNPHSADLTEVFNILISKWMYVIYVFGSGHSYKLLHYEYEAKTFKDLQTICIQCRSPFNPSSRKQ